MNPQANGYSLKEMASSSFIRIWRMFFLHDAIAFHFQRGKKNPFFSPKKQQHMKISEEYSEAIFIINFCIHMQAHKYIDATDIDIFTDLQFHTQETSRLKYCSSTNHSAEVLALTREPTN